jgi:hypothetical protein
MSTEITINQDQIDINVDTTVVTIEAPQGGYPLPNNVYSVFGRVGNVVAQEGDYTLTQLGGVTITSPTAGQALVYNGTSWVNNTETYVGTVTSVNMSVPTGLTISGNPITTAGTLALGLASGYSIPTDANQTTWTTAYNDSIVSAAVTGSTSKTLTLNQQDGGTITASWSDLQPVTSVFGRTGDVVAQSGDYNTLQVTENTNLYFTDQRARYAISGDATSGVVYSNTTGIIALDDIPNTSLLHDSVTVNGSTVALGGSTSFTTSAVAEGSNLYYTDARARAAITGTAPISVTSGVVSISQSGPSTNGFLSSADWNTFNGKQSALTFGNLTSSDITVTGGTGAVVGSGSTMTLATVNSNVGTYGSSTAIPVITVNGKGLVTAVTTDAVFIPSGALSFIGDVTGTGNTGSDTTLTLATVNSNVGAYGSSTSVPTITVNAKGLVTAASQTAIPTSSGSTTGLLTSTDWTTFNAKQAQLNGTGFVKVSGTTVSYDNSTYLTTIEGIAAGGELSGTYASPSLVNSAVTGKVLTGLNVTGGAVTATDSILGAFGKVQNQINGLLGGSQYQGTWNASTNTPTLASGVGTKGYYYIVSVAGTTNIDGITDWNLGDWIIFDGTAWQQVDNTDAVVSVNGYTGAVNLTTSDIAEGTNEYFTTSRARSSVSAGTGISYNSTTGVITNSAPDQTVSLTASTGISTSGTYPNFTITNTAPDQTVSLTASTGISTSGTYPNFTITNTAPDQTVSLTGGGTTSITGTYPNFTVTSNDQYVGTVTSVGITESAAALTITGSPVTTSGNINIGFAGASTDYVAGDGSLVPFPTVVTQAQNLVTEVYNSTGATLTKGTVVYINGGQGNLPTVTKAQANSDATSAQTYGVVRADITNMNNGYITVIGNLDNIDTQAYAAGTQLYLSGTTAGAWTSTKPYAPIHLVYVGIVVRSHPTQGVVEIRIQNGYEMDELHNVSAQSPNNGDILQYVSSTSLWTSVSGSTSNISEGSNLYFTDARARGAISLTTTGNNGASTYNSTTGVLNVPTYTLAGLGGINLTSLSATSPLLYDNTTGVFSIQQANGSQAGFLSAADWTTFNNKQAALGYTPVPQTRTLTINGVGYDLSADRSWTITPNVNATNTQDYTATAAQTTFTVTGGYTVGQLAVYYNGSKLAAAEYTATNGTTFVLATACQANDIVQAVVEITGGGIGGSGTTNYLSKWTASGVLNNSVLYDNGTNVGIGTTSPNSILELKTSTATNSIRFGVIADDNRFNMISLNGLNTEGNYIGLAGGGSTDTNLFYQSGNGGDHRFRTGNGSSFTERMRITSTGNVGIGTTTTSAKTEVRGNGDTAINSAGTLFVTTGGTATQAAGAGGQLTFGAWLNGDLSVPYPVAAIKGVSESSTTDTNKGALIFATMNNTTNAERMRITSAGYVTQKSNGGSYFSGPYSQFSNFNNVSGDINMVYGLGSNTQNASSYFLICATYGVGDKMYVLGNGNLQNLYGTYGTMSSDFRLKENITEATSKLDDLMALRVVNFNLTDDTDKKKQIGFIAQEFKEVFPSLVYEKDTREYDEDGNVTKGLEDALGLNVGMEFAILVKAMQEQQAIINELTDKVNRLYTNHYGE